MSVAERVRCVRCIERGEACGGKPGKRCPLCSQNHRKCSFSRPIEPSPRVRNVPVCAGTKTTLVIDEDSDESKIEVTEEKVVSSSQDITNRPIRALPIRAPKDKGQGRAKDNEMIVLEAENKRLRAEIDDLRSALSEARQFLRAHQEDLIAQSNRSYELSRDCSRVVEDISKRL